jgi:hypothetical protein
MPFSHLNIIRNKKNEAAKQSKFNLYWLNWRGIKGFVMTYRFIFVEEVLV